MSEKQGYPKRGETSADGRFYTHTDGSVHEIEIGVENGCYVCSIRKTKNKCHAVCSYANHFRLVEGAYVPSDEEREACDMAMKMIKTCGNVGMFSGCKDNGYLCVMIRYKDCPARAYLAAHGCADAWEVK